MAFLSDSNWVRQDMAHPLAYIRIMSKLLKKKTHKATVSQDMILEAATEQKVWRKK